jgi:cytoskeletal protein RodZ
LDAVIARTKISEKFLKAIEADDRKCFPSGFFYKSFVDQYAQALAVDAREIDEQVNAVLIAEAPLPLPGQNGMPARRTPVLVVRSKGARRRTYMTVATLVIVLVGCSGFYAWWGDLKTRGQLAAWAKVQLKPEVKPVSELGAERAPKDQPKARPAKREEPRAVAVSLSKAAEEDADTGDVRQAEPRLLLELMARQQTWLSVSSDGQLVFKGTLGVNESKTFEGKEFAKLRVNDAAALDVRLNGKEIGPLGAPGQFRIVVFTRGKFHVLDSSKESD